MAWILIWNGFGVLAVVDVDLVFSSQKEKYSFYYFSFSVGTRFDTEDRTLKDMALATRSPNPVGNKNMSLWTPHS